MINIIPIPLDNPIIHTSPIPPIENPKRYITSANHSQLDNCIAAVVLATNSHNLSTFEDIFGIQFRDTGLDALFAIFVDELIFLVDLSYWAYLRCLS